MLEGRFKNFKKISGGYYPPDPQPPRFNFRGCPALRAGRPWGKKNIGKWGGGQKNEYQSKYTPLWDIESDLILKLPIGDLQRPYYM